MSEEYSSIPNEMKRVAAVFGKEFCADITEKEVIDNAEKVRKEAGDRAFLRALHFFEENKRVEKQVQALKENRFDEFLSLITESGNSSWKWLQNCYVPGSEEQGITSALALTELFIKEKGCGACRVHGGGFAGVIMAMLPNSVTDEYIAYIEKAMGEGSAYRMSIRRTERYAWTDISHESETRTEPDSYSCRFRCIDCMFKAGSRYGGDEKTQLWGPSREDSVT